jgi:LuxR family transcriptional regulator, maltose regulon positive regulatory protein
MDRGDSRRTLATKLRPPSVGVRHMPRPRLSAALADAGPFRLALISAPAGSGKTTALTEWHRTLQQRRVGTAWLSLDDFDNASRRFLVHLVTAIQAARPDFGREALGLLSANPDVPMGDVASSLIRDFGGTPLRIVTFLDDYHEIRDRAIHAVMDFLLRYVPAHVQFVIGTRRDPPLSVGRLRVRGELLEIRWEELRFDAGEARQYLRDVCRLPLSEEQVHALFQRTEGWITGLQLAAMSIPEAADTDAFVDAFTGVQRNVTDYLLEGVFRGQPPAVRHFLLRTAILDRMTASLCDMLTGRQDGQHLIETLENANLFVFGLDDHRAWYRYHHLFAEFLQGRLRAEHPDEVAGLYDRASDWFERNGLLTEAVRYALAGNRFKRAARLLEAAGRELFRRGDFQELRRWLDALPDGTVRRSPVLCILHAWALAYLGELEGARRRIACAESAIAEPEGGDPSPAAVPVEAELGVLRAVLGIIRTDEPDVSGLRPGIVSRFPPEEAALRSYASITLGFASRMKGNLSLALRHFHEALSVSEGANSSLVNLNARLNIGIVYHLMGRANVAEESFRRSLEVARERLWLRSIGAAFLRYGLAMVLQDKDRQGEALEELSEAIAFLEASDAFGFLGVALVERARILHALGRQGPGAADLARARRIALERDVKRVGFRADLLEARMAVRAHDPVKAAACLEAAEAAFGGTGFADRPVLSEKYELFLMERLRVLMARDQCGRAVRLAGKALRSARSAERGRHVIEFLVLQAKGWNGLSATEKALNGLEQALSLAAEEGIVRPFIDAGLEIVPLLRRIKTGGTGRAAAENILSALGDLGDPVAGKSVPGRGDEPLHHREVQILKLVSQGLRNREIGDRLFLSEETVKWYLKRLYGRLSVRTRTEAVASARRLGILA